MDFSSLVLMGKDKKTGFITKELGSFEVNEGEVGYEPTPVKEGFK